MPATPRFDAIDALRGAALLWMTAFHLGFDLDHFGYWSQDFLHDPFWTTQRTGILSLFLFTAGLAQSVAHMQGQPWPQFWRRWAQIAGCALLVTAGSVLMFRGSFIFFGVLHGIALMLLVVRLTAGWGRGLWLAGALALAAAPAAAAALAGSAWAGVFNGAALSWLGLVTVKPVTEDYVPLLPWLGVMWWGMAAGQWLQQSPPAWLRQRLRGPMAGLARLGRWSLTYYMVHQPVMIGGLALVGWLRR
jgi:uncharacterized membrane protein